MLEAKTAVSLLIHLPLIICVIGLLLYGLLDGKASEAGRIMFFCGLLVFLLKG